MGLKFKVVYISVIIFVLLVILSQVKVDLSIKTLGRLYPVRTWFLIRGANGEVIASLHDYECGVVNSYEVAQVIRGDIFKFKLNTIGNFVRVGDTIGFFYSNEIEYQLARLKGLLNVEKATLKFYMTGEKEAIIEQARKRLEGAREQMEAQRKIFERAKALYEKNLISAQEFELAQTTLKVYEANVKIAEAELQSVMTGAKEEQIKLIEANIKAIQEQINVLEKRIKSSVLTSPISGVISGYFSRDTILAIMDTSKFIVLFPVKLIDIPDVKPGHMVVIKNREILTATVKGSHNRVEILNGEQVVFYIAESKDKPVNLKPGAIVNCLVKPGKVNLVEFVTKFIKTGLKL